MDAALPPALAAALDQLLEGVSRKDLGRRTGIQSGAYRTGGTSAGIVTERDVAAYLVSRLPATFAAVRAVFARVTEALPAFAPQSLLDLGAGPGTASWAGRAAWPGLARITMADRNPAFRAMAARLMPEATVEPGDIGDDHGHADLVTAAYVLAELPEKTAAPTALKLWNAAAQMLVLIEPGTPQGFARIRAARAALIEAGGHVVAPCTHDNICPMTGDDWCHFSQRLPRRRDHMIAKGAHVPFEDERYSYVVVTREALGQQGARILAAPLESKPGLTFKLCEADGLRDAFVARRDKDAYRGARRKGWGDTF